MIGPSRRGSVASAASARGPIRANPATLGRMPSVLAPPRRRAAGLALCFAARSPWRCLRPASHLAPTPAPPPVDSARRRPRRRPRRPARSPRARSVRDARRRRRPRSSWRSSPAASTRRSTWPSGPATPMRCTSSSRAAACVVVRDGALGARAVPGHRGLGDRRWRAGPARPGLPSRPGRRSPVRVLHGRRRRPGRRVVPSPDRRTPRRRPGPARYGCWTWTTRSATTTAAAWRSGRTATCTSRPATAAAAATRSGPGATWARCWPRSCASTSTWPPSATRRTPSRRTTRSSATAGARARDLGLGSAQPVAHPLRPRDRRPVDRRRRPGRLGGDRPWRRPASAAWTSAGTSWKARTASSRPRAATATGLTLPVTEYGHDQGCSVTGGTVYRGTASPALAGFYVFSDYCSGRFWAIPADAAADGRAGRGPRVGRSISAIAEDAAGELVRPTWRPASSCGSARPVGDGHARPRSPASRPRPGSPCRRPCIIRSALGRGPGRLTGRTLDDLGDALDGQPGRLGQDVRPRAGLGHGQDPRLALRRRRIGDAEGQAVHARGPGAQGAVDDVTEAGQVTDRDLDARWPARSRSASAACPSR